MECGILQPMAAFPNAEFVGSCWYSVGNVELRRGLTNDEGIAQVDVRVT